MQRPPEIMEETRKFTFAVVIPAYNAAATICRAIDSVMGQSLASQEIIIIDDGSTDETESIIEQYGPQLKYKKQSNQGAAVARQAGTQMTSCTYIAYLDADDWWPKTKLEDLANIASEEKVDFLLADLDRAIEKTDGYEYLPRNTSFFPWAEAQWKKKPAASAYKELYRLEQSQGLSLLLAGFPVFPSTMLVSKKAFETTGGWDHRFRRCQDFDFGLKLARQYPLYFLNKVHATLGVHEGNSDSLRYTIKQTAGDIAVLEAHAAIEPPGSSYSTQVLEALAMKYCGLGYAYRLNGEPAAAARCYNKSMALPGRKAHSFLRRLVILLKHRC